MKKTYLDKYPYSLERLPQKNSDRVDVVLRVDPLEPMQSTDMLLDLGSTNDFASVEGMAFKVTNYTTEASELQDGMLCVVLVGYQL
jgi:hypothetical protein|nr:MAG TPA: hypothetical protein [Caudoviricetes sp.]